MPPPITLLPCPRKLTQRDGSSADLRHDPVIKIDPTFAPPQGYILTVDAQGVAIRAADLAGAFYANQTLTQLRRQFPTALPFLKIEDWPDFLVRGVMLDISRDKVPTMDTLYSLIDMLSEWKINQLQLYMEHTFAYAGHETVWRDASPLTADEVRLLDAYCRARFIDLVPNQNSFGHMERWLKHDRYRGLAEAPDGAPTPWGYRWDGPFSLAPTNPGSIELLRELYCQLLPNFSSRLFNVGCDETFDIGHGASKAACEARGGSTQVYLDFLQQVHSLVQSHDRTMMAWGDIILHKPELIERLPRPIIALNWGYEADHPFDREGEHFQRAGVPYYACPGTSTWNSITGRTDNAIANLKSAAEAGLRHGAVGYLNTDWGDNGHLQYLPTSYLGFAAGAAFSWCLETNRESTFIDALNLHTFQDSSGVLGQAFFDLGNVYRVCGKENRNGSALFRMLVPPPSDAEPWRGFTVEGLDAAESAMDAALAHLADVRSSRADAGLIVDELKNGAAILRLAIQIGREHLGLARLGDEDSNALRQHVIAEHRRLWLARNRPGGLIDSQKRLQKHA